MESVASLRASLLQSELGHRLVRYLFTRQSLGILVVLLSAAGFGAVTPFARLAYDHGVDATSIMAIRYVLATALLAGYFAVRRRPWRLRGAQLQETLALAVGLGLISFAYLTSVRYISVSLAALLYDPYPILVVVLVPLAGGRKPARGERPAHAVAFAGQMISLVGLALVLGLTWSTLEPAGVALTAAAAVGYALLLVRGSRLTKSVPPMTINLHIAMVNAALFGFMSLVGPGQALPNNAAGWAGLAGSAAAFVSGFLGLFVGVSLIGPSRSACLSNIEPLVTISLSVALLGEALSGLQVFGAGAVLAGVFLVCRYLWWEAELDLAGIPQDLTNALRETLCTVECRSHPRCALNELGHRKRKDGSRNP